MSDDDFLASFVDREAELSAIREAFNSYRVVSLTGTVGIGKTALAAMFRHRFSDLFPGGTSCVYPISLEPLDRLINASLGFPLSSPALIVIDEAHRIPYDQGKRLPDILEAQPQLSVLLISQTPMTWAEPRSAHIHLGPWQQSEMRQLLLAYFPDIDQAALLGLFDLTQGNPRSALYAAQRLMHESWSELIKGVQGFEQAGILMPDGRSLPTGAAVPPHLATEVIQVNNELLAYLNEDSQRWWTLSARKFEEVVAELLYRQGYEVELTPASGDGGHDIYAARNDELGTFLYLVECKRYLPPRKVGVEIVRSLHGVVELKRATAGVIVTTSHFTRGAQELHNEMKHQMSLADYAVLQRWLERSLRR